MDVLNAASDARSRAVIGIGLQKEEACMITDRMLHSIGIMTII